MVSTNSEIFFGWVCTLFETFGRIVIRESYLMANQPQIPEDELLERCATGDADAIDEVLCSYRSRVRNMVALRMDKRLAARVDPSDIVQEALTDAALKLPEYCQNRPLPFYPWLRQLAVERLIQQHRRHIGAQGRTVDREESEAQFLPDHSAHLLADRLVASGTSPSIGVLRKELRQRVQDMLAQMAAVDREVLVLRFLEQLSISDTAAVLGLSIDGVKSRQRRALERFSSMLGDSPSESS